MTRQELAQAIALVSQVDEIRSMAMTEGEFRKNIVVTYTGSDKISKLLSKWMEDSGKDLAWNAVRQWGQNRIKSIKSTLAQMDTELSEDA